MANYGIVLDMLVKMTVVVSCANIVLFLYMGTYFTNMFQTHKQNSNVSSLTAYINGIGTYKQTETAKLHSFVPNAENRNIYDGNADDVAGVSAVNIDDTLLEASGNYPTCYLSKYFGRERKNLFPIKNNKRWPQKEDFLCEPELDNFAKKTLFVFVESAPWNFEKRWLIRRTWASTEYYRKNTVKTPFLVVVIFVIGIPDFKSFHSRADELTAQLNYEINGNRDILLINMLDHYDHLTYKGIAALNWIKRKTGNEVTHIFKTDDDSFVNVMGWMTIIIRLGRVTHSPSYIVGTKCVYRSRVIRDPKIRPNPVTFKEYGKRFYPPYCMGSGYLMSRDAVTAMLKTIPNVPFLRVEDVYFTGLTAIAANITRYWTSSTTERESVHLVRIYDVKNMPLIVHHLSARPRFWEFLWFMNKAAYEKSVLDWNTYPVKYFAGPRAGLDNLD
ncbi:hypothetical protein LSH36_958g00094 [Paralvinella palmiformis]|uniref:Hexosyltransferase n=1 Tax=Paralvinella palmiformis TaxID=53620 RepID=A0AAD9IYI0_9ANNE|nr:hypothetical protein LSH36_958g00094 [Paralvinella palmiformis]